MTTAKGTSQDSQALLDTNLQQVGGYGEDPFCLEAAELIKEKLGRSDVDVHFIPGGTQTNMIALAAFLRPHEAVIAPVTGISKFMRQGPLKPQATRSSLSQGRMAN